MEKQRQNRVCISVKNELWSEFSEACKVGSVGRSAYLQICMKAFIDMNVKPLTTVVTDAFHSFINQDKDLKKLLIGKLGDDK